MSNEVALRVRARAAELVGKHAARLGMDEMAAGVLVNAIRSISVEDGEPLWCCHVIGPDEVLAAPDYQTALRWAVMLNRVAASVEPSPLHDPNMPLVVAQVEQWPHGAEAHAAALPGSVASMTPQVPA